MRTSIRPVLAVAALAVTTSVLSGCALTPKPVSTAGRTDITAAVPSASPTGATTSASPTASPTASASPSTTASASPSASASASAAAGAAAKAARASAGAAASATAKATTRPSAPATPSDAPWVAMSDKASGVTFRFPRAVKPTTVQGSDGSTARRYQTVLADGTATGVAVGDSTTTLSSNQLKQVAIAQTRGTSGKAVLDEARSFGSGPRYSLDTRITVTGGKVAALYRVRLVQNGKQLVIALTLLGRRGAIDDATQRRVSAVQSQLTGGLRVP